MEWDIAVVGGGPAGLSAALQASIRGKSVIVIDGGRRDNALYRAARVDNYLGLPGVSGAQMLERFYEHADKTNVTRKTGRVLNLLPAGAWFYLGVGNEMEQARAVVLATGVVRTAQLPGEDRFLGRGVSYCATCDGMLYRGRRVAVVGKCASAPEEANYLGKIGCQVTYLSDREPQGLSDEIPFIRAAGLEIMGERTVTGIRADGRELAVDGVFLLRASVAPTQLLPGLLLAGNHIAVDRNMATNIPGVFAAGDCTGLPLQVAKAVGEGQVAGHRAAEYVDRIDQGKDE